MQEFISLILFGSLSLFLRSSYLVFCEPKNGPKISEFCHDADVIIAGAGMSGISAALELSRSKIDRFIILEASNDIGGRIKGVKLGGVNVELGANWVHGTTNNPIFELAKKYKVKGQFENPESVICRDEDGNDRTQEFLEIRRKLKWIMKRKDFENQSISLREALSLNGWVNRTILENMAEISVIDFMDAVSPEEHSASSEEPARINSLYDRQFFITDKLGYKKLISGMADEFLGNDTDKIKLNHHVSKIYWNKNGVRVVTRNGKSYTSKVLIITFSIGVLQKSPNVFEPRLPLWKQHALSKLKMATYTKIFVKFPYRFWENVEYIFYASKSRGYYPVWQSLDANNRFENATNVLLMTVTETESYRIESLSKKAVTKEIMTILRKLYGSHIPEPTDIIIPKWHNDPLFHGAYSYLPVNVSHNDFVALRGRVGPILFAGEALHEVYQGYLHGAYFEGVNKAYDAIQMLRGYADTSKTSLDYDYYDDCLRDAGDCCYK